MPACLEKQVRSHHLSPAMHIGCVDVLGTASQAFLVGDPTLIPWKGGFPDHLILELAGWACDTLPTVPLLLLLLLLMWLMHVL